MIESANELNRVLLALAELRDEKGMADSEAIVRLCESVVIEGRMPDHRQSLAFAEKIGFIGAQGGRYALTEEGEGFLALCPGGLYELSEEQRRLLIGSIFLHGTLSEETREVLSRFARAYGEGTFRWSPIDGAALEKWEWLLRLLRQLGLLAKAGDGLEVHPEYVPRVASFLSEGKGFTEEKLEKYLHERKEVGAVAEKLVAKFEKQRLRKDGCNVEAGSARVISKLRVDAGYDMESFDGKTPSLEYNRFIEIKGAKTPTVSFVPRTKSRWLGDSGIVTGYTFREASTPSPAAQSTNP